MPPPNILWIVTTQWRAQACGYAGDPDARTPILDALAAESVNYTQAVTPHPFGPFARAAMLTGVPSPANGVRDYFDPLPAGTRTIAHEMQERGYATAFVGKWHLARRDPQAPLVGEAHAKGIVPPEARGGFEFWEGFESGFCLNDPWLHGTRLAEPRQFKGYQPAVLADRAERWRASRGDDERPWFCMVSLETPHPPYHAEADGVRPRNPGDLTIPLNVPRGGAVEAQARRELAGYHAHLAATDRCIGRLLADFQAEPDRARPIVVVTSVHGDMHGAHGLFRKGWPHEESVRIPLLVRASRDGGWAGGIRSLALVSLLDLPRMTIAWAEAADSNAPFPEPKSSVELQQISMPSVVALPFQCDRVWRGGRSRDRKLILNADGSPWLYYDLAIDPLEMTNLAADPARAGEIAHLRQRIEAR